MRKIISFVVIIFLIGCYKKEPVLYFPSSEIILGKVDFGTDKKVSFEIENTGDKPLKIESVSPSCKCIDIVFPKEEIYNGSKKNISLTFKADELGFHTESIVIISNTPERFKLIHITANVK